MSLTQGDVPVVVAFLNDAANWTNMIKFEVLVLPVRYGIS